MLQKGCVIVANKGHSQYCTEVHFDSFLSDGFTTMAVINPPERKLAKRTCVYWSTRCVNDSVKNFNLDILKQHFITLHRGASCKFPFRWIYYCHSTKSTGKNTGKTHLYALCSVLKWILCEHFKPPLNATIEILVFAVIFIRLCIQLVSF